MADWETAPALGDGWETAPTASTKTESTVKPSEPTTSRTSYALQTIPGVIESVAGGMGMMGVESAAGLAGLGGMIIGKDFKAGYEGTKGALEPLSKELEPVTEPGKDIMNVLGKIPEAIHAGGEKVFEKTGSPLLAAGAETAATALTFVIPEAYRGVKKGAGKLKDAIIKDKEVPKSVDPEFEKTRMKPDESLQDAMKRKKDRENSRIKQTAFRNKETGEIETSGPKHDEAKKEATKDTHEQGFMDESGNFLTRKEALDRAKKTKQIDPKQALDFPEEGLHSGDLAKAEDPAFQSRVPMLGPTKAPELPVSEIFKRNQERAKAKADLENEKEAQRILDDSSPVLDARGTMSKEQYQKYQAAKAEVASKEQEQASLPFKEQADNTTGPVRLAGTDKEGKITLNEEAIKKDHAEGFPYIFEATSPAGRQKLAVFERLGLDREALKKLLPTPESYAAFIKAHEESHVKNNDRAKYPRTEEGKIDLEHPDALDIETRATADAIQAIQKDIPKTRAQETELAIRHDTLKETTESPLVYDEIIDIVGDSINNILADERLASIWRHDIERTIPDEGVRSRVTRAMESDKPYDKLLTNAEKAETLSGMAKAIKAWEKKLPESKDGLSGGERLTRLRQVHDRLVELPSEEHAIPVMEEIKARMRATGERAKSAGLIEALLNNYVTHVLDFSKSSLTKPQQKALLEQIFSSPKESKLKKDFTANRQYDTLRELEKAVEGTGVVVHTDIAKIAEAYEKSMQQALVHKALLDRLEKTNSPSGQPWVIPNTPIGRRLGYKAFEGKGSAVLMDKLVHPDIVSIMGHLFEKDDPSATLKALGAVSHFTKAVNTVGSLFHGYSLSQARLTADPKGFVKELTTLGQGTRNAVKEFRENGNNEIVDAFVRAGLRLTTEDVQRTIIADMGTWADSIGTKYLAPKGKEIKALSHITDPLDKQVLQRLNTFTWDYLHTGQKLALSMELFAKAKAKNPHISDAQHMKEISTFVNRTFGGLDWTAEAKSVKTKIGQELAIKATTIRGRQKSQVFLFAPDWTVSTLRAMTGALPETINPTKWHPVKGVKGMLDPKTHQDHARRYAFNTGVLYLTLLNGINMALSGHPIWENEDPTRIDQGDGTTTQAAKHSMEFMEWLRQPDKTFGNKMGFVLKAAGIMIFGTAYPSPWAPKLKDPSIMGRLEKVAQAALPFAVGSAIAAPEGKGVSRFLRSTAGIPEYGVPKKELARDIAKGKEKARRERAKKLREAKNK